MGTIHYPLAEISIIGTDCEIDCQKKGAILSMMGAGSLVSVPYDWS